MPDETSDYLECSHCGGPAIYANARGLFFDGDGDKCLTCGLPGSVTCDAETEPYWLTREDYGDVCNDLECEDCKEWRDD